MVWIARLHAVVCGGGACGAWLLLEPDPSSAAGRMVLPRGAVELRAGQRLGCLRVPRLGQSVQSVPVWSDHCACSPRDFSLPPRDRISPPTRPGSVPG